MCSYMLASIATVSMGLPISYYSDWPIHFQFWPISLGELFILSAKYLFLTLGGLVCLFLVQLIIFILVALAINHLRSRQSLKGLLLGTHLFNCMLVY